jgi:hypothetical protein
MLNRDAATAIAAAHLAGPFQSSIRSPPSSSVRQETPGEARNWHILRDPKSGGPGLERDRSCQDSVANFLPSTALQAALPETIRHTAAPVNK